MPQPIPFSDFVQKLLSLYKPPLRARATYYKMRQVLREFSSLPGVSTTADLDTVRVAAFAAARAESVSVNSVVSELRCLRTAGLFALAEGWAERAPQWRRVFPRSEPPRHVRHYSRGQVAALLEHLEASASDWKSHRLSALAATVAYTGLRKMEALRLHKADVDLAAGFLRVVARSRLKTESSAAPVPLAPELRAALRAWLPEAGPVWLFPGVGGKGPWSGGSPGYRASDRLKEAGAAAGLAGLTFHSLRHTLAKLLVSDFGGTAEHARSLLRHGSVRTTEDFYLHRDDAETLARIGRRIWFRDPPAAG